MNYAKKYAKQKLEENAEKLAGLQGADKVALEQKIISDAEAEVASTEAEVVAEVAPVEEKKKGKK